MTRVANRPLRVDIHGGGLFFIFRWAPAGQVRFHPFHFRHFENRIYLNLSFGIILFCDLGAVNGRTGSLELLSARTQKTAVWQVPYTAVFFLDTVYFVDSFYFTSSSITFV